ncbi:MAG: hypothetical protein Ct9H300mP23_08350 [Nitrospinota bacterium]|nr:MAG: hypothetical protein Ct9H300mP23_08350 [Nitrospinota bacterium]
MKVGHLPGPKQYHVEVEPDTIDNWGGVPGYRAALGKVAGKRSDGPKNKKKELN